MAPPTTDARAARRAERRARLVDDLVDVVRTEGPDVSMEQLAAGCGVTKPILYRHFDGRDGLVEAVAERFVSELADGLVPILTEPRPAVERLRSALDTFLALVEREPELHRFVTTQAAGHGGVLASLIAEQAAVAVERLLVARGADPTPARAWTYGLVGLAHSAGDWWITNRPYDRSTLVEHLMTVLEPGVVALGLDEPDPRPPGPQEQP